MATLWAADSPCKPSFMVIGAPKCGSTSLFSYLEVHPQVLQPGLKELCYFSDFKRHLQRNRTDRPSSNWELYQAGISGHDTFRVARTSMLGPASSRRRRGKARGQYQVPGGRLLGMSPGAMAESASTRRWQTSQAAKDAAVACSTGQKRAFEGCPFYLGEVHPHCTSHRTPAAARPSSSSYLSPPTYTPIMPKCLTPPTHAQSFPSPPELSCPLQVAASTRLHAVFPTMRAVAVLRNPWVRCDSDVDPTYARTHARTHARI